MGVLPVSKNNKNSELFQHISIIASSAITRFNKRINQQGASEGHGKHCRDNFFEAPTDANCFEDNPAGIQQSIFHQRRDR